MKTTPFEWASLLFTGIIAIAAIVGFLYTIFSNKEISNTLKTMTNTFETYTDPMLKFNDFKWIANQPKPNCDNPPFGINYEYKNISNFPIRLEIEERKVIFNKFNFLDVLSVDALVLNRPDNIIASNSVLPFTIMYGKEFQAIFDDHFDIYKQPYLELHLTGTISNLSETKKYNIELIDYIGFDCNQLNIKNIINFQSKYSLISKLK